jgi:uncharacterized membrane protein
MCIGSILKLKRNPASNCEIPRGGDRRRLTVAATLDPMAKPFKRRGLAIMRLTVALGVGAAVCIVALVTGASWVVGVTAGWAATAILVLAQIWASVAGLNPAETAKRAQAEDFSRGTADLIVLSASTASLVAVGYILIRAGDNHGVEKALLVGLAVVSVALSWATVHTVYALRYGDLYYRGTVGGIDFEGGEPDYHDFGYLAFTIGMTYQVSDTNLKTKQIRRAATRHALLSYLFGAVILAVAINTVSSLLR